MVTWSSVALLTPNAYRNLVQIAVPKISRKFQLSKIKLSKMFSEVEIEVLLDVEGRELTETEGS